MGLMATDDRAPGLAVPNYCPSFSLDCLDNLYGIRSYFSVGRISRDIFKQSSVGAIYTDWECPSTGEYNRVGGAERPAEAQRQLDHPSSSGNQFERSAGAQRRQTILHLRGQSVPIQFGQFR